MTSEQETLLLAGAAGLLGLLALITRLVRR